MTDREINRAIAEFCGWKFLEDFIGPTDLGIGTARGNAWLPPGVVLEELEWFEVADLFKKEPPNYCIDLNAMHEAEATLTEEQQGDYANALFDTALAITNGPQTTWHVHHATARQRAEAFIRVINNINFQ
jgi:hypothetical protein